MLLGVYKWSSILTSISYVLCSGLCYSREGKGRTQSHVEHDDEVAIYICEVLARLLMPPFSIKDGITVMYVVPT